MKGVIMKLLALAACAALSLTGITEADDYGLEVTQISENGDPFTTGDSYGPRAGDFRLYPVETTIPSPAKGGRSSKAPAHNKCRDDSQAPGIWMECAPAWRIDR